MINITRQKKEKEVTWQRKYLLKLIAFSFMTEVGDFSVVWSACKVTSAIPVTSSTAVHTALVHLPGQYRTSKYQVS